MGALQIPVVGLAPLKSLEQLGPMGVFFIMILMEIRQTFKRSRPNMSSKEFNDLQWKLFGGATALLAVVITFVLPEGYFGPLSSRIRCEAPSWTYR